MHLAIPHLGVSRKLFNACMLRNSKTAAPLVIRRNGTQAGGPWLLHSVPSFVAVEFKERYTLRLNNGTLIPFQSCNHQNSRFENLRYTPFVLSPIREAHEHRRSVQSQMDAGHPRLRA